MGESFCIDKVKYHIIKNLKIYKIVLIATWAPPRESIALFYLEKFLKPDSAKFNKIIFLRGSQYHSKYHLDIELNEHEHESKRS